LSENKVSTNTNTESSTSPEFRKAVFGVESYLELGEIDCDQ